MLRAASAGHGAEGTHLYKRGCDLEHSLQLLALRAILGQPGNGFTEQQVVAQLRVGSEGWECVSISAIISIWAAEEPNKAGPVV
jgi:hypothetical protein